MAKRRRMGHLPVWYGSQRFQRLGTLLWSFDVYRSVRVYRMEFYPLSMSVIWHKKRAHHSTMSWSSLCRYFCSQRFCFGTTSIARSALSHHFSPARSMGLFVRLKFDYIRHVPYHLFASYLPIINPYFWLASKLLELLIDCCCSAGSIAVPLPTLVLALLLFTWVLVLWFPSQLKFGDCFSNRGLRLLVSETCSFDWSTITLLSLHSLIGLREVGRTGASDIRLFILDDELCESPPFDFTYK